MELRSITNFSSLIPIGPLLPETPATPRSIIDIFPKSDSYTSLYSILSTIYSQQWAVISFTGQETSAGYEKYLQFPNATVGALAKTIVNQSDTDDTKMYKIEQWVQDNIKYVSDTSNYGVDELWVYPTVTLRKKSGDCIANFEEIYTKKGLTRVGDLKVGDEVLSYDFNEGKYVYKPIVKIWEKGYLPGKRVHFRNGSTNVLTNNHPMLARTNQQGKSIYEKTYLKDMDLSKWYTRKIPLATHIPYEIHDVEWLTEGLCFVLGHYLAEGWHDVGGSIYTSGYAIPEYIQPILDAHNIPYTFIEGEDDKCPRVRFLDSDFKKFLRIQKINSFDIHMEEWLFALPENKLKAILNGHKLGDGHDSNYPDKRGFISNKQYVHSTSSYEFAQDIQRIALQLGFSFHIWKQMFHGGAGDKKDGKHPIWRLTYNPKSHFLQNHGYEGLSEVSIKKIEDLPLIEMRDFEVADTHNFISKNGNLLHNCEDGAFLMHSLALSAGISPEKLRTYGGLVYADQWGLTTGGHAWTSYKRSIDNEWVITDWCYWATDTPLSERQPMSEDYKYIDDYFYVQAGRTVETPYANKVRYAYNEDKGSMFNVMV
jgi:hypothetical protein